MKTKKAFLSLLLVLSMLSSLMVAPVSAAAAPTLTITPSVTTISKGTGTATVVYTIEIDPNGNSVGAFAFELHAPEGMTLSKTKVSAQGGAGYWLNSAEMQYSDLFPGYDTNPFETFAYNPDTGYLGAAGSVAGRELTTKKTVMTVQATVDISADKTYTLGVTKFLCGDVLGNSLGGDTPIVGNVTVGTPTPPTTDKYTVNFSAGAGTGTMTPVQVTKAASGATTYALPSNGGTFTAPAGKAFRGWFVSSAGFGETSGGVVCHGGQSFELSNDIYLTALWGTSVTAANFTLSNYTVGTNIVAVKPEADTATATQLSYRDVYGTGPLGDFFICTDAAALTGTFASAVADGSTEKFAESTTYYLVVALYADADYSLAGLTKENVKLNGTKSANALLPMSGDGCQAKWAVFTLDPIAHSHNFNVENTTATGALKSAANCQSPAVYYKSCACGAVSTSDTDTFTSGAKNNSVHVGAAGSWTNTLDPDYHYKKYAGCGHTAASAEHTYDNNFDATCNDCGYARTLYTVTFAKGDTAASGTMTNVNVTGSYSLPACGFTAPGGKQFKAWSVSGTEKAVGATITVTSDVTVTAVWEDIPASSHTVTVQNDGNGTASATPASAVAGTTITLSHSAATGYHFKEWQVVSGTVTISGNTFTMPDSDVTVKAIFEADATPTPTPTTYTVTVNGSEATTTGAGSYAKDATVTINAGTKSGCIFGGWTTTDSGVTFANAGNATTTFTMPDHAVTVTANWLTLVTSANYTTNGYTVGAKITDLTISGGATGIKAPGAYGTGYTVYKDASLGNAVTVGSDEVFAAGTDYWLKIQTIPETGYTVNNLIKDNCKLDGEAAITIGYQFYLFKLPKLTAAPAGTHSVTMVGGGTGATGAGNYSTGATVTINAGTKDGYVFKNWTTADGVTFTDATSASTTFSMPDKNVTVTANWLEKVTAVNFSMSGHTLGATITDLTVSTSTTGLKPLGAYGTSPSDSYYVALSADGATKPAAGATFEADTDYYLGIYIAAADGYTLTGLTTSDVKLGTKTAIELIPVSPYVCAVFKLDNLSSGTTPPAPTHTHTYGAWSKDATNHWHECTDTACPDKTGSVKDLHVHTYDNGADTDCNDCGYIRTVSPSKPSGGSSSSSSRETTYPITVKTAKHGDVSSNRKSAASGTTVTITVDPDKGYDLETLTVLDKNGKEIKVTAKNGKYTFKMPASKVTVEAVFAEDNSMLNFFVDVPADAYYADAVLWAAENGITGGVDEVHFAPNAACTRAQIVTFLWRAAGSPAPKTVSSFTDVSADAYYADAVAWAVENGITGGMGDGRFAPNATCTRAQAVTFLYRAAGSPAVGITADFSDVAATAYYANAVAWAAENGITGGIGGGLFGSNNDCTRAQIVTFLYRSMK